MLYFVANYLRDQQGNILGYDPINEPEPGSLWTEGYIAPSNQTDPKRDPNNYLNFANGYPVFDPNYLGAFYQQCAIPSLQAGHPGGMIWCEPNVYFDYNAPTFLPDLSAAGNVGFNFHNYDNTASGDHRYLDPITNARDYQSSYNVPLLCSEFGGTQVIADIQTVASFNDEYALSSIFWAWFNNAQYPFYGGVNAQAMGVVQSMSEEIVPPNLNQDMLDAVTRVYPRVIAGKPGSFSTEPTPGGIRFSFEYSPQLPNGQTGTGTTRIVIPAGLYPGGFDGFDVIVPPGVTWTKNEAEGTVDIVAGSQPPTTISVVIQSKMPGS